MPRKRRKGTLEPVGMSMDSLQPRSRMSKLGACTLKDARWMVDELKRIGRFGVVGLGATGVHMAMAVALMELGSIAPLKANLIAFLTAFFFSFFGHHYWTFEGGEAMRHRMLRFFVIAFTAFALNNVLLVFLISTEALEKTAAVMLAVLVIPFVSFVLSRVWAFR